MAARTSVLESGDSIFLEGFAVPQPEPERLDWEEFDGALQMVKEALNVKSAALERASSELQQLKQQCATAQRSMHEMRRAELDSGCLREEVETLMMAKYDLLKDFAELERKARLLWLERELICEQLEVDPDDEHNLVAVLERKLEDSRRCEGLEQQLVEAQVEVGRLREELTAARSVHKRCRSAWQKQERMLMKVLATQAQLCSSRHPLPPSKRTPAPSKSVKYLTHPYPRLQISSEQLQSLQVPTQPISFMPRTPPASSPTSPTPPEPSPSSSAVDRAFEALELGTTRLPATRIFSAPSLSCSGGSGSISDMPTPTTATTTFSPSSTSDTISRTTSHHPSSPSETESES